MAVERVFSPEIEAAFFDLDDTLVKTNVLFGLKIGEFFDFCEETVGQLNIAEFKSDFKKLDDESFAAKGVSVRKWVDILGGLSAKYDINILNEGLKFFADHILKIDRIQDLIPTLSSS